MTQPDMPITPGWAAGAAPGRSTRRLSRHARRLSSLLLVTVTALTAGLGSGSAYGYWTSSGSGLGSAATSAPQAITLLAASGTISSKLVPGGRADLLIRVDNPNSHPVFVTGVAQDGPVVADPSAACESTGVTVPNASGLSIEVLPGSGVFVHLPGGAAMSADSDSGCQGASFLIPVSLVVRS